MSNYKMSKCQGVVLSNFQSFKMSKNIKMLERQNVGSQIDIMLNFKVSNFKMLKCQGVDLLNCQIFKMSKWL